MATNGKTIKQIADELGVSKQAVQKRIAKEPLYTRIYPCIHLIGNTKYIDEEGKTLIKRAFEESQSTTVYIDVADNQSTTVAGTYISSVDALISMLQTELKAKDEQLAAKDRQIEELIATVKTQAESITVDRKNELAGTIIDGHKMFTSGERKRKWQFWKKDK